MDNGTCACAEEIREEARAHIDPWNGEPWAVCVPHNHTVGLAAHATARTWAGIGGGDGDGEGSHRTEAVAAAATARDRGGAPMPGSLAGGRFASLCLEPICGALAQILNLWPGTVGAQVVKLCQQNYYKIKTYTWTLQ